MKKSALGTNNHLTVISMQNLTIVLDDTNFPTDVSSQALASVTYTSGVLFPNFQDQLPQQRSVPCHH